MSAADLGIQAAERSAAANPVTGCAHCGLPVPTGLVSPSGDASFCCEGCRSVYEVLHGCGLEQYYALRAATTDGEVTPAPAVAHALDYLDDPAFAEEHVKVRDGGIHEVELHLESVHCAACVWLVERLPQVVPGVIEARLSLATRTATLRWDPERTRLSTAARGLARLGYPAHPARDADVRAARRREDRSTMIRIAVAGALAGNVMLLAFALYGGHLHGMADLHKHLFGGVSAGLAGLALVWPGRVFFRGAMASIRTRRPHLDLPIAIGLTAGYGWSLWETIHGSLDVYYDVIGILVFLLLLGRWIQSRQQRRGHDAVSMLFAVAPSTARRLTASGGRADLIPLEAIEAGDLLEVRAGDTIPVDGTIRLGRTTVDEAMLTGERDPITAEIGATVLAGTTNLSGHIEVEAVATGDETRAGRLMDLVRRSAEDRAPVVRRADRLAAIFVPVVLGLAALTIAIHWSNDPGTAIGRAMTLLIISCPCALGLATPLAIIAALGQAARRRILITGGAALEALSHPGIIVLDKTGTLTAGRRRVVRWVEVDSAEGVDAGAPDPHGVLRAVACLERASAHPIAAALVAWGEEHIPSDAVDLHAAPTDVVETTGLGIEGTIDGVRWRIGRPGWISDHARTPRGFEGRTDELVDEGLSPLLVAREDAIVAAIGVGDPLQPDAEASIAALVRRGWRCEILSGDDPRVVRRAGERLGLPTRRCRGGATPEAKLERVRRLARRSTVVVVGDGVNDAAALSAATVGIAVHGGAEASLRAADVSLDRPGLTGVVELVDGAARTVGVIRRNLAVSLGYNVVGVGLAMVGLIDPIVAAILMPASSLTVITLSYRSRTFAAPDDVAGEAEPLEAPDRPTGPFVRAVT